MRAPRLTPRHAWALSLLSACAPLPSELEREGACGPDVDDAPGLVVAAASDEFTYCSSCEPRCLIARDTLRSWDIDTRGGNGLAFDPASGGVENSARPRSCVEPPCPLEYEYSTGATYTRLYDAISSDDLSRSCDELIGQPVWQELSWDATIPPGTEIVLELRGGRSVAEVRTVTPVTARLSEIDTPTLNPTRVLMEAGLPLNPPILEVRVILHASVDRRATPTLRSLSMEIWCWEGE